jgi:hypothetical protein
MLSNSLRSADEYVKAASSFSAFLRDPSIALTPWSYSTGLYQSTLWDWWDLPENQWRRRRFTAGLEGAMDRYPEKIFVDGRLSNRSLIHPTVFTYWF